MVGFTVDATLEKRLERHVRALRFAMLRRFYCILTQTCVSLQEGKQFPVAVYKQPVLWKKVDMCLSTDVKSQHLTPEDSFKHSGFS